MTCAPSHHACKCHNTSLCQARISVPSPRSIHRLVARNFPPTWLTAAPTPFGWPQECPGPARGCVMLALVFQTGIGCCFVAANTIAYTKVLTLGCWYCFCISVMKYKASAAAWALRAPSSQLG